MVLIDVISDRKGSNPGGKATIPYNGSFMDVYLKYCTTSHLSRNHPFDPNHQPVYEALTINLADRLGLKVPDYFLLLNQPGSQNSVKFNYPVNGSGIKKLDDRRPIYFLSRLVSLPHEENAEQLAQFMKHEKLYRDFLMIGDVSNKKQNFALIDDENPHVLYIDLGCSFVDSSHGILSQRNKVFSLVRSRNGEFKSSLKKDLKDARKYLGRTLFLDNNDSPIMPLEFIDSVPSIEIPLFPRGSRTIDSILNQSEIEEIQTLLIINIANTLREYHKDGRFQNKILF